MSHRCRKAMAFGKSHGFPWKTQTPRPKDGHVEPDSGWLGHAEARSVAPFFFSVTKRQNGGVNGNIIYKWDQSILNFTEPNGFPLLERIFRTASDFRTLTSSMDQCHLSLIWTSHCFLCHKWVILGPIRLKYSWIFGPNYLRRRTIHKKK